MTLYLDRITHRLRLAKGSNQSGKGCAMNVDVRRARVQHCRTSRGAGAPNLGDSRGT